MMTPSWMAILTRAFVVLAAAPTIERQNALQLHLRRPRIGIDTNVHDARNEEKKITELKTKE